MYNGIYNESQVLEHMRFMGKGKEKIKSKADEVNEYAKGARYWYLLAVNQGNAKTQSKLAYYCREGIGMDKPNITEAGHWCRLLVLDHKMEEDIKGFQKAYDLLKRDMFFEQLFIHHHLDFIYNIAICLKTSRSDVLGYLMLAV